MLNVIDLMNDTDLAIDNDLLKDNLLSLQKNLNKRKIELDEVTGQIKFKESQTSSTIINYCADNFSDLYSTISDKERKLLLSHIIKEIHVSNGESTKSRQIKN